VISPVYSQWAESAKDYFREKLGADKNAAKKFALLYVLAYSRGLNPRITRIYSDKQHHLDLQKRWDAGQREGLRARPANNSKHIIEDFWKNPASKAMDMPSDNDREVARLAREIGLGAGEDFKTPQPDPGHYFDP